MQPKEVLELIGSAPERYDTVRAAPRYRGDGSARKEIRERIRSSEAGRRAFGISPPEASAEAIVDVERDVLLRTASRLGGKDFDALEVEEIHFDERFDEDTFASRDPLPWR